MVWTGLVVRVQGTDILRRMTKQTITFGAGALALVLLGLGALYLIRSYIPEYQARKAYEQLLEEYKNDPYGGDTPEETLQLFIDALKKGDVELAAKYYIFSSQERRYQDLIVLQEKNELANTIKRLEQFKLTKQESNKAFYVLVGDDNLVLSHITLERQIINNKWKLTDL